MPRYHVYGKVVGSTYLGIFEAESPEQAIENALESDNSYISLCHQCSRFVENPEVESAIAEEA